MPSWIFENVNRVLFICYKHPPIVVVIIAIVVVIFLVIVVDISVMLLHGSAINESREAEVTVI